ncbi:cell division protein FtsQ [Myroides marinus]|nr:cell division protein FtsQ [Myroides marinus]MDM1349050.1 cell division protein FtsQ [Myroides marinus]MDM1356260.1 cell division protein FtsQ [Myroides marinus]MDM1363507.1 cell division protein FtsQ [Myroides marinus]MDM1531082.1 cell division protein FtsQ [Myroides marinus]
MKKLLNKIRWSDVRILLICGLLLFLYSFTNKRGNEREVDNIYVVFKESEEHFVTTEEIRNLVKNKFPKISKITRSVLDLNNLEKNVLKNELIRNADVYLTVDNKIIVDIWQKKAIGRVIDGSKNYYLDEFGKSMPLSTNYSDRVPMVQGTVNANNEREIKEILELINKDEFLREDITGIIIEPKGTLMLVSRTNRFDILFGGFEEKEVKLQNYKAFVQYLIREDVEHDIYKYINLKFTKQVVCTK